MAKVFISYKREEVAWAQLLRGKLGELGVDFFMDDELTPDGNYNISLDKQLAEAAAVLVLWTRQCMQSEFVYSEAQKGNRRKVLVAVMLESQLWFDDFAVVTQYLSGMEPDGLDGAGCMSGACTMANGAGGDRWED